MIKVTKIADLMSEACSYTINREIKVKSRLNLFKAEHSPVRTCMYWIEMIGIPSFVSTHFVRHKLGVEHFVQSNRVDRNGGNTNINRMTPINHAMLINAQALINMARKRLCHKSSVETQAVMNEIKEAIKEVDQDLYECLLPECLYRGGTCFELKSCGFCKHWKEKEQK